MLRFLSLAALLVFTADAWAQPFASEARAEPIPGVAEITPETPARLRLAVVVQQQAGGNSCNSSDSSCGDGADCSNSGGSSCGSSDGGSEACLLVGGCVVLSGVAAYGIYRLIKRRRGPDSLDVNVMHGLTQALAAHAEIVAPDDAEAIVIVQETGVRRGVGLAARARQFVVTATDRSGQAVLLGDGPLPSARLVLTAEAPEWSETARTLATRLAAVR